MTDIEDYSNGFEESKKRRIQQKNDEIIKELNDEQPKEAVKEQPQEPAKEGLLDINTPEPRVRPSAPITDRVTPVYELPISDDERQMIIKSRISAMIKTNKVNAMPTLITCRYRGVNHPVKILCEIDQQIIKDAWQFYSTNVESPTSEGFIDTLREVTNNRERVYQRVAEINLL